MAIYHLSVKIIARSSGKNAVSAAAYRSASKLRDERQNIEFDYLKKRGVAHSEILCPKHSPEWAKDREKLWNKAEAAEKRINSQIAREVEIAIPIELTKSQGVELVRAFVQQEFVSQGMVADFNIHLDNPENPHAHILLTTREIAAEGFTNKNRSWNQKDKMQEWRRAWAELANEHLRVAGQEVSIDHRSYQDQGVELVPTFHLGQKLHKALIAGEVEKYSRLQEYQAIAEENGKQIIANPKIAIEALTSSQSVFTETDIAKFAHRHSNDVEQYQEVVEAIKSQAVAIAKTDQGKMVYSSHEMIELEDRLLDASVRLSLVESHEVKDKYKDQALHGTWWQQLTGKQKMTLNEGQLRSLDYVLGAGDLKIVVGFAGTGKSSIMRIAKDAWEAQGYRVLGTALSGIAAQNLQETGIQSRTIDSLLLALDKGVVTLGANDVLVLDEAGMVNSQRFAELLLTARQCQTKMVLIGDPEQLQPIQAGAPFRALAERLGYVEMSEVVRQLDPFSDERTHEMREASKEFATDRTAEALARYDKLGGVYEHRTRTEAIDAVIDSWNRDRGVNQIMLAYTRKDVAKLNDKAREVLKNDSILYNEHTLQVKNREGEVLTKQFAINERIYFIKNDSTLGVKNGSLGTILSIKDRDLLVLLDTGAKVAFNLADYDTIDHGYAATIHKSQGITVDKTYFLTDKYLDRHSTYVAATRHRSHLEIHYDNETFRDMRGLRSTLSRSKLKGMVADYAEARSLQSLRIDREQENIPRSHDRHDRAVTRSRSRNVHHEQDIEQSY